jgi:hypothetical protein
MRTCRTLALAIVLATLAALLLGGCGPATPVTLVGTVEMHKGHPAQGGQLDPTGYVLTGQKDYVPLYLQRNKSLTDPEIEKLDGRKVEVTGYPMYYSYPALYASWGQSSVTYWILNIVTIKPAGQAEQANKTNQVKQEGAK